MGGLLFGLDAVVISGAIGPVKAQFALSGFWEGLFVAASLVGCAVGAAAAGPLADQIGRKLNLILAGLVTLVGVSLCTFAQSIDSLILSRLVGGLGVGIASMTCPLYIAEISPAYLRGQLVSLYQFAITFGIVIALFCNAAISGDSDGQAWLAGEVWRSMFGVQIPAAALFMVLCTFIPESPRWLLMRGKTVRALRLLAVVLGQTEADRVHHQFTAESSEQPRSRLRQLLSRQYRRPALIAVVLAAFSELSGITVIFYYGPLILQAAGARTEGALSGFAILGVINMAATLVALALLDRVGRRKLLMLGSFGCAACMLVLGLALQCGQSSLVANAAICVFVAFYAFSLGPTKFVVASEIFPRQLRGLGTSLGTTTVWFTGAVINQLFPVIRDVAGPSVVFYFCAASLIGHLFFVSRFLPETANKSLEEIEGFWNKRDGAPATPRGATSFLNAVR
jgi:sugar porter (SP) family MFS transporter